VRHDFSAPVQRAARKRANGFCEGCGLPTGPHNPPEVDHDKEDWEGGLPTLENAKVLGRKCCHRFKTAAATTRRAKADRAGNKHLDIKPRRQIIPGSRASPFKKKLDGTTERRS
jgi:hypothetical protein